MNAFGRYARANACGTCRKAVKAGEAVVHEKCAARAVLLQAPDYPNYEGLLDLSDDERLALPARFHTPHFDSLGRPNLWQCRVCWGDGWVTAWPCKVAQENGAEVFTHRVDNSMPELDTLRARVAELEAAPSRDAVLAEVAAWLGKKAREYRSTRNRQHALQAETLETMASKIRRGAVRPEQPSPQHQLEDPHASPLHHDYALGRDDLAIPRQVTGRCPNCNGTFEDCTCGGAS